MVNSLKIVAIIQCRISSDRLPAKAMLDLGGKTLLERVMDKAAQSSMVDEIWIATSTDKRDEVIEHKAVISGFNVFRGELNDVLDRYYHCAKRSNADIIIRITADNPLTYPGLIDSGIKQVIENKLDYVFFKRIPYGCGVEVITKSALFKAHAASVDRQEREHVTLNILNNPDKFKIDLIDCPFEQIKRPEIRVSIDTLDDYLKLSKFYNKIGNKPDTLETYIQMFDDKIL